MNKDADLVIIGSGPAGCSASIYSSRASIDTLMLEGDVPGGQLTTTMEVENYPGLSKTNGPSLMDDMRKHATMFGATICNKSVKRIDTSKKTFTIICDDNTSITTKAIIIASGSKPRYLDVDGESKYYGSGISYCATCDGFFFKGKDVAVIGGGNAAVESALHLSRMAAKVMLIHRRDRLRAEKILQDKLLSLDNVECIWNDNVKLFSGDGAMLDCVYLASGRKLRVQGAFISIGHIPATGFLEGSGIKIKETGTIDTFSTPVSTNIDGIFTAGDVMDSTYMQAITSAGFGCMAALEVQKYLDRCS